MQPIQQRRNVFPMRRALLLSFALSTLGSRATGCANEHSSAPLIEVAKAKTTNGAMEAFQKAVLGNSADYVFGYLSDETKDLIEELRVLHSDTLSTIAVSQSQEVREILSRDFVDAEDTGHFFRTYNERFNVVRQLVPLLANLKEDQFERNRDGGYAFTGMKPMWKEAIRRYDHMRRVAEENAQNAQQTLR